MAATTVTTTAPARPRVHPATLARRALDVCLPLLVVVFIGFPLLTILLEPLDGFDDVFETAWNVPNIGGVFVNTVWMSLGSLAIGLTVGVGLCLCTSRLSGRLYTVGALLATFPILLPTLAAITGWTFLFSPTVGYGNQLLRGLPVIDGPTGPLNIYSLPWIVGLTGLYLSSYVFVFVSSAMRELDPSIEAAAIVSGAGWLSAQFRIVLPAVRPAILYGSVIAFLLALGQFTAPLLLGRSEGIEVITTEMHRFTNLTPRNIPVAALLAWPVVAMSVGLAVLQRKGIGSVVRYAPTSKGTGYSRRKRVLPIVPVLIHFFVAVVPPVVALLIVSLSSFWSADIDVGSMSFDNYRAIWDQTIIRDMIVSTFQLAAVGTLVVLILGFLVARYLSTRAGPGRTILDSVVNLPIAVPAIVFGLGVFLSYGDPSRGLYGTRWLFIVAWTILVLPHSVRVFMGGYAQIGRDMEHAARVAGSTGPHAIFRIVLPLLRRSFGAAGMLAFILMSHEFAAAELIRTTDTQVLSTELYQVYLNGLYPRTAALAVIMMVVSFAGAAIFAVLGGRGRRS